MQRRISIIGIWLFFLITILLVKLGSTTSARLVSLKLSFERPDQIEFPHNNPFTQPKYDLGKTLFFDPRLSGNRQTSCASCHNPGLHWTDGLPKAIGEGHKALSRKTPTILNTAWGWSFFWDGRAATLEEQALKPIQSKAEMNLTIPELISRLRAMPKYVALFSEAFPGNEISGDTIARAIATFERTIVSEVAPFDEWISGNESAITPAAKRGFLVFTEKGSCVKCHTGWRFTNESFADTGVSSSDEGRGKATGESGLRFTFKTPTLRNIAERAPYMHDGSVKSLEDVIAFYNRGGQVRRPLTTMFLKPLQLTDEEASDLLVFLKTLTSNDGIVTVPSLPLDSNGVAPWENITQRN